MRERVGKLPDFPFQINGFGRWRGLPQCYQAQLKPRLALPPDQSRLSRERW